MDLTLLSFNIKVFKFEFEFSLCLLDAGVQSWLLEQITFDSCKDR